MTEGKKNFFELLDSKSALILGVVAGFLFLCTIGFAILLYLFLSGSGCELFKVSAKNNATIESIPVANNNQPVANAPKSDKPVVELFVMSYCPYGLQMEKAVLPAWKLLDKKANISIKFVSYAMHGLTELEENTRQYCIATEQSDKIIAYLECFTQKDDYKSCLTQAKINVSKMNSCVTATDKKFGTLEKYKDQTTWLSGRYPLYPVHEDLNNKYGVQGSPTLVINGQEVSVSRTPEAVKTAICNSFYSQPDECKQTLSNTQAGAGFGNTAGTGANVECET